MLSVKGQGKFWDRVTEHAQPIAEARQLIESLISADAIRDRDVLDKRSSSRNGSAYP